MCEILDNLKMTFETHHDIYLPACQYWHMIYIYIYIHWIRKKTKKTSKKKFDVNTRDPRPAQWDFRGVPDESLFFYLEFDMNSYLNNWDNCEVLRMKFWGFIVTIIFIYGSFLTLRCFCLQFWNFAVLNVLHMHYPVLFLIYSYVCTCTPALLYPIPFLVYCFPGIAILPTSPHSFKALLSFVQFWLPFFRWPCLWSLHAPRW